MWFKNLLIYRFTRPFDLDADALHEKLAEFAFSPCGGQDMTSLGWVKPLGDQGSQFIHQSNGCIMVCSQHQDKVLPAAVIKDVLEEKIATLKQEEDRIPGRKERMELKGEVIFELLPRAFARSRKQYAYIDPANGWLVIDSASHKRAEEQMVLLRESIGSLPVIPLAAKNTLHHSMTDWLKSGPPQGFELGGECELIDAADESAVIRCKNQNLASKDILNHVEGGMFATKLALNWSGGLEFIVDDQLCLKRLRFSDLIMEKADNVHADSFAEQFDVDFALMSGELARFIPAVLSAFGGEDASEIAA